MATSLHDSPETREANCAKHGDFEQHRIFGTVWSGCAHCELAVTEAELAMLKRQATAKRLEASGLRGRYVDATFSTFSADTPEKQTVLAACQAYTAGFDAVAGGLWLIGPPGTGKSHLGAAMVNDLIRERGTPAMMLSGREVIRRLRATWSRDSGLTEQDVLDQLGRVPLLVLDEVGVGSGSEVEHAQVFDVVDERYAFGHPTVVLSNLKPDQMKATIGHRAYDRLREGAKLLTCNWSSHRGAR